MDIIKISLFNRYLTGNEIYSANENGLKWIKIDTDFQKYGFMNVKINSFQF